MTRTMAREPLAVDHTLTAATPACDLSLSEFRRVRAEQDVIYADDRRAFVAEKLPTLREMDTKRKTLKNQLTPLRKQVKEMREQKRVDEVFLKTRSTLEHLESEYDDLSVEYWSLHAKITAARNWLQQVVTERKQLPKAS